MQYLKHGIAPSTQKTYSAAQDIFLGFCGRLGLAALPASEGTLMLFVTELAQTRAHTTIRTYLAGVRHLHVIHGLPNPLEQSLRLDLVLKGIRRIKPKQGKPRLPITPHILLRIKSSLDQSPSYDSTMLWAACTLAFFAFLRCGEFTVPALGAYDQAKHLSVSDIAVDSHTQPTTISARLKVSKTDQFGKGILVFLGKASSPLCPVAAVLNYLARRGATDGPLFLRANGQPLTRKWFVEQVQQALMTAGIDSMAYNGHSFRIGAATTAAACGLNEALIKTLGRWASTAYQVYIRIPQPQLAAISPLLATAPT